MSSCPVGSNIDTWKIVTLKSSYSKWMTRKLKKIDSARS